ncbi:MAG: hydroxymethylglutaryl-CoA reductase, degradative [Tissierellia bacterium]|nr:hydroxymethylglutaryl-CoA reductase, degradative [Tissierellia bacterium]
MKNNNYSGFYKLSIEKRLDEVSEFTGLNKKELEKLCNDKHLSIDMANNMVENVIGLYTLPIGLALNFIINEKEYLIPMVTEEPSVIAAASNGAKITRSSGGFYTSNTGSYMIGQIQVMGLKNVEYAKLKLYEHKKEIIDKCNQIDPVLNKLGGGAKDIEIRKIKSSISGDILVVHLIVNTLDAMGANAINTMAEYIAPTIEKITGGEVYLRILSNLAIKRIFRSSTRIKKEELGSEEIVDKIISAYAFAEADPFRAATHNKGIMNGISAAVLATGNDTRAIESAAHSYASLTGRYKPLTIWEKDKNGDLLGSIEIPLPLGLVGGATKVHPTAGLNIKILGVKSANELSEVIASLGLAQNLAAIRALATEGIQRGHMSLHAKNIAVQAGAKGDMIDKVVKVMIENNKINLEYAKDLLRKI